MLEIKVKKRLAEFSLDVSFTMEREIVAILGPSGCGKTMTLKSIAGLMHPDEGHILLDDKVLFDAAKGINLPPRQRKVGFVFQNYALFPNMTVYNNIIFGIRDRERDEIKERVSLLMHQIRLDGFGHRYPWQLSAGQQQRVALARALATEPEVLLLDEPFSALDTIVKEQLERELQDLYEYYQGHVLLVTHNLAEAYRLSSRIAVYEAGSVLQLAEKQQVINAPASLSIARLTGVGNLFDGLVAEVSSSMVEVLLIQSGDRLKVRGCDYSHLQKEQPVVIGIRSEYIQVIDQAGENTLYTLVSDMFEEVSVYTYHFSLGSGENHISLEAKISKQLGKLAVGQSCHIYLAPERLFLIPKENTSLT